MRSLCFLITFIKCASAQSVSSSSSSSLFHHDDDNKRWNLRALYESNPLGETALSDVWLCLAFALGWTVWLLSSLKQAQVEPSIFDEKEAITVTGNVLDVTVGESADGTGIPVYLALIDYVVECYDPDEDTAKLVLQDKLKHPSSPPREGKTSTEKFKKGVVFSPSSAAADKHLQIRKCFYTNKLLDVGFANVKVLCLVEDPTTSELWEDYLHQRRQRKKPADNWMQLYMVYGIAIILIVASFYGGYRTVEHLPKDLRDMGYISMGCGALALYPLALFLYSSYCFIQRWISERKGTIIHGSERWHCTRMACGIHPILEEEDESSMLTKNSSTTQRMRANIAAKNSMTNSLADSLTNIVEENNDLKALEMPKLHHASDAEYAPPKPKAFPNAGCALNEYNVLQTNPSTVSSISSTGRRTPTNLNESSLTVCDTSHLMETFEIMSAFGGMEVAATSTTATPKAIDCDVAQSKNTTTNATLQKLGKFRRISSESRISFVEMMDLNPLTETVPGEDEVTRIYSA